MPADCMGCSTRSGGKSGSPATPRRSATRWTSYSGSGSTSGCRCWDSAATGRAAYRQVASELAKFSIPDDPAWVAAGADRVARRAASRPDDRRGQRTALPLGLRVGPRAARRPGRGAPGHPDLRRRDGLRPDGRALAGDPRLVAPRPWPASRPPRWSPARTGGEMSARGCFQWALLCELEERHGVDGRLAGAGDTARAVGLLVPLLPGLLLRALGQKQRAMEHYQAAVALRARFPVGTIQPLAPLSRPGRLGSGAATT